MKMAVALCGAMWHYPKCQKMPKTGKTSFFDVFQESHENGCGAMWRYPKCQKMPKTGKTSFFDVFQESHENGCVAMWR